MKFSLQLNIGILLSFLNFSTNCKSHNSSTRHDENKYYGMANNLKESILSQYPVVTVCLKPLIYDPTDKSIESLFLQKRIGAFEVQLCKMDKSDDEDKIEVKKIFSKIETKKWPDFDQILDSLSDFVSRSSLVVELKVQNEGEYEVSSITTEKKGKLKNIEVFLKPIRMNKNKEMTSTKEFESIANKSSGISFMNKSRPVTATATRPKSAYSNYSVKTMQPAKKGSQNGEGPSFMNEMSAQPIKFQGRTNDEGLVTFDNIPLGIYMIDVPESKEFTRSTEVI